MSNDIALLTQPYVVYLAAHDTDVTLPVGTEFELIAKLRDQYFGLYQHPKFGEIGVDTSDAVQLLCTGNTVLIECDGRNVPGKVTLASPNGVSLMLEFDALLDGHVGQMAVLRNEDGTYTSILSGTLVKLR